MNVRNVLIILIVLVVISQFGGWVPFHYGGPVGLLLVILLILVLLGII